MEPNRTSERKLPDTETGLFAASTEVIKMRGTGMSWKEISEATGYTRVQAIRLAHNVFELATAIAQSARHQILYQQSA